MINQIELQGKIKHHSKITLYADDTTIFNVSNNINDMETIVNETLINASYWFNSMVSC